MTYILMLMAFFAALPAQGFAEAQPQTRSAVTNFKPGAPVFIRIFKETSTLEVWMQKGARFALYERFSICKWSGDLGPKLEEGDRQSPEGVYSITMDDLRVNLRWHRAMDVNFPNAYDAANGRTGSGILIHGKCSSIGCFALTDESVERVYDLVAAALEAGQARVPVHIFPFPLTSKALAANAGHPAIAFWRGLRPAYAAFELDRLPPQAKLCGADYAFSSPRSTRARVRTEAAKCPPLAPKPTLVAAAKRQPMAAIAAAPVNDPKTCNPKQLRCRMLRIAAASPAPCPKKYARCRNPTVAAIKSIDCPLKFPRCRKRGGVRLASVGDAKRR
jgi:murein L,D-transpeptidase YafK